MNRVLRGALLSFVVVVATFGLDAAPAFADPPSTTPTMTAPTDGATVAGDVTLHLPSGQRVMVHVTIPLDQVVREVQHQARALRRAA